MINPFLKLSPEENGLKDGLFFEHKVHLLFVFPLGAPPAVCEVHHEVGLPAVVGEVPDAVFCVGLPTVVCDVDYLVGLPGIVGDVDLDVGLPTVICDVDFLGM